MLANGTIDSALFKSSRKAVLAISRFCAPKTSRFLFLADPIAIDRRFFRNAQDRLRYDLPQTPYLSRVSAKLSGECVCQQTTIYRIPSSDSSSCKSVDAFDSADRVSINRVLVILIELQQTPRMLHRPE